jgi:glycosyltransferase involved in cell wall biosynthesis
MHPKSPVLLFVHGDEVWNDAKHRKTRPLERLFLRLITRIASVSRYTADVMAKEFHVSKQKFVLLPNAVDQLSQTQLAHRNAEQPMILTVSRLGIGDYEKHVDKVLRAVALLREDWPSICYEIVGEGVLKSELQELARELGLQENVVFHGRADEKALSGAYARASIFILPSSKEGFGIVFLEAWLHGLPVICGSEGAPKEVVTDGVDGYVVNPYNIEAIAASLGKLLKEPVKAREMGNSGFEKVKKQYLNIHFEQNLNKITDDMLERTN